MSNANLAEHNLPVTFIQIDQSSEYVCFRINGSLNYKSVLSTDINQTDFLNDIFNRIINDLDDLKFIIKKLNLVISDKESKFSNFYELLKKFHEKDQVQIRNLSESLMNYISIDLFKSKSTTGKENYYSPCFVNHKGVCCLQIFNIPIDCVILAKKEANLEFFKRKIHESLHQQIIAIKNCYMKSYQNDKNFVTQPFHYLVKEKNLFITCIYANSITDDLLTNVRKEIHCLLDLPIDQPLIRRVNALQLDLTKNNKDTDENKYSRYLKNPHLSLKTPISSNGKISLVQGDYLYFHYMQDNFNDNGWGCAYRSFQTIFSWFKFQSYTQKPIPSHLEIQKTLVDLGDKSKDFVGSRNWIGSMEISFCLSNMINVESKILSVSNGSELAQKARELQFHFDTEGTPVMIGGGLLAHTIIGVNFDEITGSVQYLILDPHYTGAEDIKTITGKGWIGWKEIKFWKEDSFYNLCCPIRPKGY